MKDRQALHPPLCPSSLPDQQGSMIIGVVGGTIEEPRVAYLAEPQAVTDEIQKDLEQSLKDFKEVWAEKAEAVAA